MPATNPSRRLPRLSPAGSNVAGQAVALRCSVYGPIYPAPPPSPFQAHLFRVAHLRRFQEQRSGGRAALIDVRWHACAAALWFSSAPRNEMRATQVPLSALLLSAVHPVTLYTHTQPSTATTRAAVHQASLSAAHVRPASAWNGTSLNHQPPDSLPHCIHPSPVAREPSTGPPTLSDHCSRVLTLATPPQALHPP